MIGETILHYKIVQKLGEGPRHQLIYEVYMVGKEILHYKIIEKIGAWRNRCGVQGQNTKLNRVVALKFLPTHSLGNDHDRKRFETEAKAAAALNHPKSAPAVEYSAFPQKWYSPMQFRRKSLYEA